MERPCTHHIGDLSLTIRQVSLFISLGNPLGSHSKYSRILSQKLPQYLMYLLHFITSYQCLRMLLCQELQGTSRIKAVARLAGASRTDNTDFNRRKRGGTCTRCMSRSLDDRRTSPIPGNTFLIPQGPLGGWPSLRWFDRLAYYGQLTCVPEMHVCKLSDELRCTPAYVSLCSWCWCDGCHVGKCIG